MTEKPTTAQELEELFGNVDLEQLIKDAVYKEFKEGAEEMQRQYDKHLLTTLYGSSFADMVMIEEKVFYKKIKRRLYYDVWYWSKNGDFVTRVSKYFESAMKARKYVNHIHNSGLVQEYDYVRMEKTWCYREHHPKHKWFYISFEPNQFVCVEKY